MNILNWHDAPEAVRRNGMPFCGAMQDFYVDQFRARSDARRARLAELRTREDALAYVRDVRARIRRHFRFPEERSPLRAQTVCRREEHDHNLEGVIFFSRPGLAVSALFATPKTPGRYPGVLFLCGHSATGKLGYYQTIVSDLARQGFAVLVPDPIGQGERRETDFGSTFEHNFLGRHLGLAGESFASWRTYDAVRALDYLCSRDEVDPAVIGVTGCSGGCTLTSYVMAVDDRPTMAAASCAITSFERNVENEFPCDIEQLPQGLGAEPVEMADLLIAAAPRPILILGQDNDGFDVRGAAEAAAELGKIYALLGCAEDAKFHTDCLWHWFSMDHRFTMQSFFGHYAGLPPLALEKLDKNPIPEAELHCAPTGRLADLPDAVPHDELAARFCRRAAAERPRFDAETLRRVLLEKLAVGEITVPRYRVLRRSQSVLPDWIGRFGIETEPGRVMAVLKARSDGQHPFYQPPVGRKVLLYVGHLDAELELNRRAPEFDGLVCGLDVRGIGELTPGGCEQFVERDFFHPYEADYHYAALGDFLGEPVLGGRVRDILRTAKLLEERRCTVALYGRGQGGIAALFAAFLGGYPVTLENVPESYLGLVEARDRTLPQALLPFDILHVCDLDELIRHTHATIMK